MKTNTVTYTRRYNTGNFEFEEYTLQATVEENEVTANVIAQLQADVEVAKTRVAAVAPTKSAAKKKKPVVTVEEEEEVLPVAAKAEKKKKFKSKPQVYQRTNDTHKEIFSGVLTKVFPTWKTDAKTRSEAKKVSKAMEGIEFLDEAGTVLPKFEEKLIETLDK